MRSGTTTYAVVAHDAGGAELVSSYIKNKKLACLYVLEGAAVNIFRRKLGAIEISDLESAVAKSNEIICGTSWESDLELRAIFIANRKKKKSRAFLDHWLNYKERFERKGNVTLPDEIWVFDSAAKRISESVFPNTRIVQASNPYLRDIAAEIRQIRNREPSGRILGRILFIGENISGHASERYGDPMHFGYTEATALSYFVDHLHLLNTDVREIAVRPHPSESGEKYLKLLSGLPYDVSITCNTSLIEDIVRAEIVVGCSSMALVIASLAKKLVVSCIPPGVALPPWPYKNILELRRFPGLLSRPEVSRDGLS